MTTAKGHLRSIGKPIDAAHGCEHCFEGCCPGRRVCTCSVACGHGICCNECWSRYCGENLQCNTDVARAYHELHLAEPAALSLVDREWLAIGIALDRVVPFGFTSWRFRCALNFEIAMVNDEFRSGKLPQVRR